MPETIKAAELPLGDLFNDKYRFEIPDYQRQYSWTTEETGELLDDLLHALKEVEVLEKVNEASPYFLGSIVIVKSDDLPKADVVDDQQRITTLTIMFCVLRELIAGKSPDFQASLSGFVYAPGNIATGVEGHFRLRVRPRDEDLFQNRIQVEGELLQFLDNLPINLPDSRQRMFGNAKYLWEKLSELNEDRRNILTSFLAQRCYLVVVSTSDRDSAYRIFSVLNDRGLDLSPTDILKAQIIGGLEETTQSDYTKIWEDREEELGRDDFRDIFAHIRMIYLRNKMRGTLQQEFQEGVLQIKKNSELNDAKAKNFIDKVLVPYADVYKTITTASYKGHGNYGNVNEYLSHLNRLDNFDWIPPAMAFFKRHLNDTDALLQFVQGLERLAYGMFIRRANINERINRYADVLRSIECGDVLSDGSAIQISPQEKLDLLNRLDGRIYSQLRVRKPLLLRLDSLLADGGATYDHPIITIEHVLPQNPPKCSQWRKWFPDETEREEWTHKLANLVLLSRWKNSSAQNYEFDHKKNVYFNQKSVAPFALTTQVLNTKEWSLGVLESRQKELISILKKEWRLD